VASFNVNRFVRLKHPIFAAVLSVLDRVLKDIPWPCRSNCPRHWDAVIANIQVSCSRCGLGSAHEIEHGQFRRHFPAVAHSHEAVVQLSFASR
jgi:hypothetical protein